ncbi:unnamed protein product [Adineta steineri]|uniref:E3 ubiquitin-protein ligase n=1 Tax=Adineta steineri TaxID=433720 RepID=A0A813RSZ4_9BILA|nr:unnamed protein product [Adineta steineri]CAF3873403.1 unnamed protein product [Adineta steineri]
MSDRHGSKPHRRNDAQRPAPGATGLTQGQSESDSVGTEVDENPTPDESVETSIVYSKFKNLTLPPNSNTDEIVSETSSTQLASTENQSQNTELGSSNEEEEQQNNSKELKVSPAEEKTELDRCAICMDDCIEPKQLDKCGHTFCTACIDQYFKAVKPQCPCCFTIYGNIRGNQPENGTMKCIVTKHRLPGYEKNSNGTIRISYYFPNGIQDDRHPSPGARYHGTSRDAYLPDNKEGREILELLQKAFEFRQVFTVGQSRTTGCDNVVTWNDIHHKTSYNGGTENFGYPDDTYLNRVRQELAAKGIIMFSADKIDDSGVWLGDITSAENIQALDDNKISHILTILDYEPRNIDKNRTYLFIHAEDFQSTDLLTSEFEKCFQFIDKAIEQGHQVLIHCHAGVSRSATIAAMYLMRKYSLTREQALERLINKRRYWSVLPNDSFLRQLDLFHQMNYKVDIENEFYKEFQKNRFGSKSSTNNDASILILTDENEKEYKCRNCHIKLFTNNDIQKHEKESSIPCNDQTQIFTFFLDWIDEIFTNPHGAINCPNCKIILGEYSLKGLRCHCHQWIKPAFIFQCQLIE